MLRDATDGDAAGPHGGYTKTRGVVVAYTDKVYPSMTRVFFLWKESNKSFS